MQCRWPSRASTIHSLLAALVLVAGLPASVLPSAPRAIPVPQQRQPEKTLRHVPAHTAEFAPVYRSSAALGCEDTRPPEALLTPDPIMQDSSDELRIRVSFIIGADGRVQSAFILKSGGHVQDRAIMRAIRRWRYRPALCNGVPTPMEAQVSFVLR
jgi:TonB family protein